MSMTLPISRGAAASRPASAMTGLFLALPLLLATVLTVPGLYPWIPLLVALVVAHHRGMVPGIAALVLLSLPIAWLGGLWHPAMALGAFLTASLARRRDVMAAEATALYGLLATALFALFHALTGPASSWLLALPDLRDLMSAILLAAIADVLNVNFIVQRQWPFVAFDPSRSILRIVRAGSNPLIIIFILIPAMNQVLALGGLEAGYRAEINAAALPRVAPLVAAGRESGAGRFRLAAQPRDTGFYYRVSGAPLPPALAARRDASCATDGTPVLVGGATGPCALVRTSVAGRPVEMTVVYMEFGRGLIPRRYGLLLLLLTGALLAWFYRSTLSRTLRDTFEQADMLIGQFGERELAGPPSPPIGELEAPVDRLVALNNASVALRIERERLAEVAADLNRSIGLKLMREVRFDAEQGILGYTDVRLVGEPVRTSIQVHPDDCAQFRMAGDSSEAVIEFRLATATDFECLLVTLHDSRGGLQWASGVMVQLNRPRHLDDIMAKQARLADLGNVASSIGHEIKQPLFTIAVAAESLRLLATRGQSGLTDPQIIGRVDRISEQVGRARDIIEHITRYGKSAQAELAAVDVGDIMRRAHSFLESALDDQRIDVNMAIGDPLWAVVSRVELEQVFVNAIQNAIDSIVARRAGGWNGQGAIELSVASSGSTVVCAVADNGLGLAPSIAQSAFSAFFTTKSDEGMGLGLYISRQIVERAGGQIALRQAEGDGAILEIELPAAGEPADQQQAASSSAAGTRA